jgi:hypothetical protein
MAVLSHVEIPPRKSDRVVASQPPTARASTSKAVKRPSIGSTPALKPAKQPRTEKTRAAPKKSVKTSESGFEHDTSGSEDDNGFGDVDLKQTEEEEELELIEEVYKGRSRPAKTDHNGERIWKCLEMEFRGESIWTSNAEYAMRGIAAQHFFAEHWTVRLRHTVKARIKLAYSIDQADVDESALCLTFWRFYHIMSARNATRRE